MSLPFVPLPYRDELAISAALDDVTDPELRKNLEAKFRGRFQRRAQLQAVRRSRFREAIAEAVAAGHPDPRGYAAREAEIAEATVEYEKRVRAVLRRAISRSARALDRQELRREAAAKSANPSKRRLKEMDRQFLEIVGKAEGEGRGVGDALVVSEIHSKLGAYKPPVWDKTTTSLKVLAASIAAAKAGARTINLRLTPEVRKAARRSPRGTISYLQDRIRREFIEEFGPDLAPDFWIVLEADLHQGFHLHGAMMVPAVENVQARLDAALRRAGGRWGARQDKQQVSRSIDDPCVWAAYVCKRVNLAAHRASGKPLGMTRGMQGLARDAWLEFRGDVRAHL